MDCLALGDVGRESWEYRAPFRQNRLRTLPYDLIHPVMPTSLLCRSCPELRYNLNVCINLFLRHISVSLPQR